MIKLRRWLTTMRPVKVQIVDSTAHAGARLIVEFDDGKRFDDQWNDKRILRASLAHWRKLYNVPLEVNGVEKGVVSLMNEELCTGYFPYCACHARVRRSQT